MDNTRNRAQDLIDMMFCQLERMDDDELTMEEVRKEMLRSQAMCAIVEQMTEFTKVQLAVAKAYSDNEIYKEQIPRLMSTGEEC